MKKALALLCTLTMLVGLAACGNDGGSAADTSEAAQPTAAADTGDEEGAGEDAPEAGEAEGGTSASGDWKVGFLIPTTQAEFFIGLAEGLEETMAAQGIEVMTVSFDGDTSKAISAIENMVISNVDCIIAMVSDASCDSALAEAQQKGVLILESGVETSVYDACLLGNNIDIGIKIGTMAANFINEDLGGEAKVAVFTTEQNVDMNHRGEGMLQALEELAPGAEIVEVVDVGKDVVGAGTSTAETLLQKYPDLNVICAYGDLNALEAAEAVNAAGKGGDSFGVFACDATAEGLKKIADGDIFRGTVYMGDLVATMSEYAIRLLEGETFDGPIQFENIMVTADNVADYQ